jgi:hypothetical protein
MQLAVYLVVIVVTVVLMRVIAAERPRQAVATN